MAATINRFHEAHPYADPFKLALINPDDGSFAAQALSLWEEILKQPTNGFEQSEDETLELPGLEITAFTRDHDSRGTLRGLDSRRRASEESTTKELSDHLRPSLATTIRSIDDLRKESAGSEPKNHHLAIVQNLSVPEPVIITRDAAASTQPGLGLHGLIVRNSNVLSTHANDLVWHYWVETESGVSPHPVNDKLSDGLVEGHRAASAASARLMDPNAGERSEARAALAVRLGPSQMALLDEIHRGADWVLINDRFIGAELFDSPDETTAVSDRRTYILDASPEFHDGLGHQTLVTTSSRDEVEAILTRAMGKFGFRELRESVGSLIQTLKMVSGRLLLDALRADARAAEVVALGAVITWLQSQGLLRDAIVVPVDTHLDMFRPPPSDRILSQQRCDLMLFRMGPSKVELTLIEVKGRSSLDDLDTLAETMTAQMDSTGTVIQNRCFNDDLRLDGHLQRSSLAHVLRFYLARAKRYGLIDDPTAATLTKRVNLLERKPTILDIKQRGFIIALSDMPSRRRITVDERTEIQILSISDIAAAADGAFQVSPGVLNATVTRSDGGSPSGVGEATVDDAGRGGESNIHHDENKDTRATPLIDDSQNNSQQAAKDERETIAIDGGHLEWPGKNHGAASDALSGVIPHSENETLHGTPLDATDNPGATGTTMTQDVVLGDVGESPVVWQPRVSGSPHLFILGIPGQGKSVTTERILLELARTSTPALVLDFHGTFADPNGRYARIANPTILDAARGLPFSPFAVDPRSSWNEVLQHAKGVADVLDHVFGLGEIQADLVYTTLRDLYRRQGFSDVDEDSPLPEPPTLADVSRALERKSNDAGVRNVIARTRSFFDFDLFKPDKEGSPTLDSLLLHGLVVGLHRLGGEELSLSLSAFLLRTVYLSMTRWPIADHIRLAIVLDEAHKLARDVTLPKLMKEGRKYGVAIVVASQGLADFHPDIVGNAGTKVSFRVNYPDSRKVGGFFQGRQGQNIAQQLERLSIGQAIIQTPEMPSAVRVQMRTASD